MRYDPDKSVKQNALDNDVSVPTMRKYIKVNRIDRLNDERARVHEPIHRLHIAHPDWSARRIARELGISQTTAAKYINVESIDPVEGKWSARKSKRKMIGDFNAPIDFMRMEEYDTATVNVVAFSNGLFKFNGHSVGFSNMKNYPITFFGERFSSVETAYIACCYGLNDSDHIRIQREIQAFTNGLKCKRQYRLNALDSEFGRKDFHGSVWHFNLMLYLVWQKCKAHPKFCDMLLAVPDGTVIIENQNGFKKVRVGDWGCKNADAKAAYDQRLKVLMGARKATTKMKEKATIETWNLGVWKGMNHCGKILMACRAALRNGTEPFIDYRALNDAEVYLFGERLIFNSLPQRKVPYNQRIINNTLEELEKVIAYDGKELIRFGNKGRFSIFSNFYPFTFTAEGETFHSVEQFYHWKRLQGNPKFQATLLSYKDERNAWKCFDYSRNKAVKLVIEQDLVKRIEYMREGLRYKLERCEGFKEALLRTGDRPIAELNQTRKESDIWSVDKKTNIGSNILGKLLMELRETTTLFKTQDGIKT